MLWILSALALTTGVWALLLPSEWYSSFPDGIADGGFQQWILMDGPFNEHFIRDVGALNLALAAAGIYAAISGSLATARVVAVAWVVFSAPHLLYHLQHLHGLPPLDAIAEPISLALTLILPIPLLLPERGARSNLIKPKGTHE